ncbi:MAG: MATE family efflux transporter [Candidatus Merdivicinus sp.]
MSDTAAQKDNILGTAPIGKLILRMSVPTIVAQLINALYNIVDRIYIGRLPGDEGKLALAGLGIAFPIIMVISAFAALIGMGGAPLAAIRMGEGNRQKAEQILGNCMVSLVILSIVLTAILLPSRDQLLIWFGASSSTLGYGSDYLAIYLIGTIFVQIALGMNNFITAQGFSTTSMLTVLIGAVTNIVLDPILIFGLDMGVRGAALATIIAQAVSAVWVMIFFFGKKSHLRISRENLRLRKAVMFPVLSLGVSPFIMQSTESLVQITFTSGMQKYGNDDYVGAIALIITCMQVVMMPLMGFSQGAQPIVSYNYGAQNFDRVKKCFRYMLIGCTSIGVFCWLFVMLFPSTLIYLFNDDPTLVEIGVYGIRIFMFGIFVTGVQNACQSTFVALGQAKTSMFLALLRKIILLIPLALILPVIITKTGLLGLSGTDGLFLAEPIADICAALTTLTVFLVRSKKLLRPAEEKSLQNA